MAYLSEIISGFVILSALGAFVQGAPAVEDQHILALDSFSKHGKCTVEASMLCLQWMTDHPSSSEHHDFMEDCAKVLCKHSKWEKAKRQADDQPSIEEFCEEAAATIREFPGILEDEVFQACMDLNAQQSLYILGSKLSSTIEIEVGPRDYTYTTFTTKTGTSVAGSASSSDLPSIVSVTGTTSIMPPAVDTILTTRSGSTVVFVPPSVTTTTEQQTTTEKQTVIVVATPPSTVTVDMMSWPTDTSPFMQCVHAHKIDQEIGHCYKHHGDEPDHLNKCLCKETGKGLKKCADKNTHTEDQDQFHDLNVRFCEAIDEPPAVIAPITTESMTSYIPSTITSNEVIPAFTDIHTSVSTRTDTVVVGKDLYGDVVFHKVIKGNAAEGLAIPVLGGTLALLSGVIGVVL